MLKKQREIDAAIVSTEAIAFQSGRLYADLTDAIGQLRKSGKYTTADINAVEIPQIVLMHTNMRVSFDVNPTANYGAFIRLPEIDMNHPFIQNEHRVKWWHADTGATLIRAMGGSITGGVDKARGRVSGIYADIQGDIVFGIRLMRDKSFTDGELAAILMHELGHIFTYFEYMGSLVKTAHVMGGVAKAMYDIDSFEKRIDTLKEAERVLGVDILKKESIAAMPNKNARALAAQSVLVSAHGHKSRSETGYNIYEIRSVEQLADQFAARHGAGADLATGLGKLYDKFWFTSTLSMPTYVIFELMKLILFTMQLWFTPIPMIIYLFTANPTRKIYDDPEARTKLLRQQMTEELKNKDLDDQRRKQILADIDIVKGVEDTLDDKRTLMELFWTTIMPSGRAALNQEEAAKEIETLLSNELFVISNKFASGA